MILVLFSSGIHSSSDATKESVMELETAACLINSSVWEEMVYWVVLVAPVADPWDSAEVRYSVVSRILSL